MRVVIIDAALVINLYISVLLCLLLYLSVLYVMLGTKISVRYVADILRY